MAFLLWLVIALLKLWVVCIRKTVPSIDDNIVTILVSMTTFIVAVMLSLIGIMIPQKPALAHV